MEKLHEIFSTRELALVIWLLLALPFVLLKFGKSIKMITKAFFAKQLAVIYLVMTISTICIVTILQHFELWNYDLLKDTIFWFFTFAFVILFKILKASNTNFFIEILNDIFKLTLFLEFISNFHTFSLWIELIIFPIILLITPLKAFSETDEKNLQVTKVLSFLQSIMGLIYLSYSVIKTIGDYQNFFSIQNLKALVLTPILSLSIIPLFYLIALYNNYEQLFLRIRIMSNDPKIQRKIKYQIFHKVKLNLIKSIFYEIN
jgi:membrane protein YdbS with pleckstrin-like domain